ncbi:MAG: outer membrane beta-barrel protein [Bacteroidota bacterium]
MVQKQFQWIIFFIFLTGFLSATFKSFSQQPDSTSGNTLLKKIQDALKITGYIDAYYAYYSDSVGVNNYQKIPDISPKSNVFGINTFQITAQYSGDKIRAVGTLHYGDVAASAWSPIYNMIQEANAGVRLGKQLWLDAGFFKTHVGTEALMPKDNLTSSLSVITFYEPWWQSGVKLTYTPTEKLLIALHVLNGYNRFDDNNKDKTAGLSLVYTFNEKGSTGYFNMIGEESPEGTPGHHLRVLHNLVFNYQLSPKLKLLAGTDFVTQQNSGLSDTTNTATVFSGIVTLKFQAKPKFAIYARGETFSDKDGILTGAISNSKGSATGYISNGATLGFEFKPVDNAFIRLEGRDLIMDADQDIFYTNGSYTNNRFEVMMNIGVTF